MRERGHNNLEGGTSRGVLVVREHVSEEYEAYLQMHEIFVTEILNNSKLIRLSTCETIGEANRLI
jgi:hypothetical protein